MGEKLPAFPDSFLEVEEGCIYGKAGDWAIVLALKPFELDGEKVETQIGFDFAWEVKHPRELAGKTFRYTEEKRDDEGIEASVFLRGAHHPVDVRRVVFGKMEGEAMDATLVVDFVFDHEDAGFANRSAEIRCRLQCKLPKRGYRVIE